MPKENIIEIANFTAGVRDATAFEPRSNGASRMLNYQVDYDGELVPRKGYEVINPNANPTINLSSSGEVYRSPSPGIETGPFIIVDTSYGRRIKFRLPVGSTYVIEKDRLYYTTTISNNGYWVDMSLDADRGVDIFAVHEWTPIQSIINAPDSVLLENNSNQQVKNVKYTKGNPPLQKGDLENAKVQIFKDRELTERLGDDGPLGTREQDITYNIQVNEEEETFDIIFDLTDFDINLDVDYYYRIVVFKPDSRPSTDLEVRSDSAEGVLPVGLSHPIIYGLGSEPPTPEKPIEIFVHVANNDSNKVTEMVLSIATSKGLEGIIDVLDRDDVYWRRRIGLGSPERVPVEDRGTDNLPGRKFKIPNAAARLIQQDAQGRFVRGANGVRIEVIQEENGDYIIRDTQVQVVQDKDGEFVRLAQGGSEPFDDLVLDFQWDGTDTHKTITTGEIITQALTQTLIDKILGTGISLGLSLTAKALNKLGIKTPLNYVFENNIGESLFGDDVDQRVTMSPLEYENSYLVIEYTLEDGKTHKFIYHLSSYKESNVSGEIAESLTAGFQVGNAISSIPGAQTAGIVAGAGVAGAGIAASVYRKATEGERVRLTGLRTTITPANDTEKGFYPGQMVYVYTFSDTKERTLETLPSKTQAFTIPDFENIKYKTRSNQIIRFKLPPHSDKPSWANFINIYVARYNQKHEESLIPQSAGLEYSLIAQLEETSTGGWRDPVGELRVISGDFVWQNEKVEEPRKFLESFDNDSPPSEITNIISYGSRIWGINKQDQTIRYSKVGTYGYNFFPNENSIVPQNFSLEDTHQEIVALHPAANDSMLYVFKANRIHFIRGHGDIKGLYSPLTPLDISIDASLKKEGVGTIYPRSITNLKDIVMFLGSDKILYSLSGTRVEPFSISIQPIIDSYTDKELKDTKAFTYRNCYHLCLPNELLVLDLQKNYWTIFDWVIKDVFWAQDPTFDGDDSDVLYAIDGEDRLVSLYSGDDDGGEVFSCEWESNPMKIPYESVISGVHVYHDMSNKGRINVSYSMDNKDYKETSFAPSYSNRFRKGIHARGHRFKVKITDSNEKKLRIDRLGIEV